RREEVLVLLLADIDAAAPAADDHSGPRLSRAQPGIAPRLAGRNHAEQRGARVPSRIGAALLVVIAVERGRVIDRHGRHPSSHTTRVRRDIELRDGPGAADAAADVIPVPLAADAERRHNADACDDDTG